MQMCDGATPKAVLKLNILPPHSNKFKLRKLEKYVNYVIFYDNVITMIRVK